MLGARWRWDDDSLKNPDLRRFLETSTRGNLVVKTSENTTNPRSGFRALATGSRDGKIVSGWTLGQALLSSGMKLQLFGEGAVEAMGVQSRTANATVVLSDSYRGASSQVLGDLLAEVMQPGSVVVVDTTVLSNRAQQALLTEVFRRGETANWNVMALSLADVLSYKNQQPMVDVVDENLTAALADFLPRGEPRLQVFAARGPHFASGAAKSGSIRRDGLVQITDVTATVLDYAGITVPAQVRGTPIETSRYIDLSALASMARRAAIIRPIQYWFITLLTLNLIVVLIAGVWSLNRRTHRLGEAWEKPRRLLGFWRAVGTYAALVPAFSFLMNLVPWWNLGSAQTDVAAHTFTWFGAILPFVLAAVVALIWSAIGLNSLLGPLFVISILSLVIGLLDPLIGSPMVLDTIMGTQSTIGGRFYGIDNMMFAVMSSGALMFIAVVYNLAGERNRNRIGAKYLFAVLIVFAVAVVLMDSLPGLGADFGGTMALIPGFAVLFIRLVPRPIKPLSTAVIALFTVAAATLFAYIDWLRPVGERTHLGNFIDSILAGQFGTVLTQKASMVWSAGWPLWLIVVLALAVFCIGTLIFWPVLSNLRNPYRRDYAWLLGSAESLENPDGIAFTVPERAFIAGWLTTMVIGMLLNDSSVIIGLVGLTVVGPALLAHGAHRYLTAAPTEKIPAPVTLSAP